jgi:hypothetical protein
MVSNEGMIIEIEFEKSEACNIPPLMSELVIGK